MPVLYDNKLSRNGYKIRLLAAHAGIALERVEIDILKGESRTQDFVARNVAGRSMRAAIDTVSQSWWMAARSSGWSLAHRCSGWSRAWRFRRPRGSR